MTDKEKIIAEIERLKSEAFNKINHDEKRDMVTDVANSQRIAICEQLLDFIDSLPAEQPSEDLDIAAKENLPNAPYSVKQDNLGGSIGVYGQCQMLDMFKSGANWQKEQMLKSAIDGTVGEGNPGYPQMGEHLPVIAYSDMMLLPKHFKFGDKIKIIVIKEDEQ